MKNILFLSIIIALSACGNPEMEKKLAETEAALAQAETQLSEVLEAQNNSIVHTLYFTVKEDITEDQHALFVDLLKQLGKLPYVNQIKIGTPADIPDPRAKKDYDYAMEMQFADADQLKSYAVDSTHLSIRAQAGPFLAGPPVVYDFEVIK